MDSSNDNCEHYMRKCLIFSPCCQKWFSCRICHDEKYTYNKGCQVEQMDRHKVKQIKCKKCQEIQPPQQNCQQCGAQFGYYFCKICVFFDDDDSKKIYHCEHCGICRIGKKENCIHCFECNLCYSKKDKNHICQKDIKDKTCAICLEDFFYSRKGRSNFPNCNHPIHYDCLIKYLQTNQNCPICAQSIQKEPEQFIKQVDQLVNSTQQFFADCPEFNIWCHNCRKQTDNVKFNAYGMKCTHCGSYNTKQVQLIY